MSHYLMPDPDVDVPTIRPPANRCSMCGADREPLEWSELCEIRDGQGFRYGPGWRCTDRAGCRKRRSSSASTTPPAPEADASWIAPLEGEPHG